MIKNKKLILINIFLIFFCSTYGNTFTLDDLKKNLEKGAKSLEQEINKQNNTESQKQQAQPKKQQAQSSPSNDLTIKETNFVNINHQEAVKYFNSMRGEIDKKRAQIESLGGLSGKQIFCKGRGNDRFGFYFMEGIPDTGRSYFNDDRQVALLYRFVPDPERNPMIDVGSRNVIHPALEIGSIQYYEDKEKNEINLSIEKINRETLDFYQVVNPLSGYNYKKVGKCEIFEGDLYIQFKKLSDNFDNYRKDQRKKQNEKNKL